MGEEISFPEQRLLVRSQLNKVQRQELPPILNQIQMTERELSRRLKPFSMVNLNECEQVKCEDLLDHNGQEQNFWC